MNAPLRLAHPPAISGSLLAFANVHKAYRSRDGRERIALDGVSFELASGEVLALIGSAASGKSAFASLAAGIEQPSAGVIAIDGAEIGAGGGRRDIALLGSRPDLPHSRPVREIITERRERTLGATYDAVRKIDRLLDLLEIGDDADRYADELSDGARRKAALACALAAEPRLLILDEATSALDPEIEETFLAALSRVNAQTGVSILLITHDMTAVTALASRVLVLDAGRIVEQGATAKIFAHPAHAVTRRFAAAATGAVLPPFIVDKLSDTPSAGGRALVRLAFEGPAATKPVLTNVARELGFDLGIVAGSLGAAGGEPYGVLIVAAPADEPYFTAAVERLEDAGLGVEVLGFVA
ncbi:MAG TPA: ATP-binding cassette domain-containing protein [Hansschlegelia sp.]